LVIAFPTAWWVGSQQKPITITAVEVLEQEEPVSIAAQIAEQQRLARLHPKLRELEVEGWERPAGPPHVAIQIGHLETAQAPEELRAIRGNTGAQQGAFTELEAMIVIADQTKALLEAERVKVTLLPVTIPPGFYADVFLALHADGSTNTSAHGYKIAAPRRDATGQAGDLVRLLEEKYEDATGLARDPKITWNMVGYYAFNWRRFEHAMHPMSVAAIVETGFLTNAGDRTIIVNAPEKSATGIADGVMAFLQEQELDV